MVTIFSAFFVLLLMHLLKFLFVWLCFCIPFYLLVGILSPRHAIRH